MPIIQSITDVTLLAFLATCHAVGSVVARLRTDERGEGVISAAIAVLIMAFLGAAMWIAFKDIFEQTSASTRDQVGQIGR